VLNILCVLSKIIRKLLLGLTMAFIQYKTCIIGQMQSVNVFTVTVKF